MSNWTIELLDQAGATLPGGQFLIRGDKLTAANVAVDLRDRHLQAVSERVTLLPQDIPLELEAGEWVALGVDLPVNDWGRVLAAWERKRGRSSK